jgi:hypothetical protein
MPDTVHEKYIRKTTATVGKTVHNASGVLGKDLIVIAGANSRWLAVKKDHHRV